jgi:hypothetical protein
VGLCEHCHIYACAAVLASGPEPTPMPLTRVCLPLQVASARMLSLDRLGMNLEVARQQGEAPFKLRLPFVRPAEDRKGIKEVIVDMTRAAKAAAAAQEEKQA